MADSQFRCPLCSVDFNTDARIPRLIPSCGHTFCTSCLVQLQKAHPKQLIVCPEDQIVCQIKKPAAEFPKNLALFTLIQKTSSSQQMGQSGGSPSTGATINSSDLCKAHKRKLEVICVTCKDRICTNCALFGNHKHHDIRMEEEIFKEISERADYLIEMYDVLEEQQIYFNDLSEIERLYLSFKTKQLELRKQVETRFKEIKTALKNQETRIHQTLEAQFAQIEGKFVATRDVPRQILREVEEWKDQTKELLDELTQNTSNPNYIAFELLEAKTPEQNHRDLVTNGFALIQRLENTSAMPSRSELNNLINQTKVHFNPEVVAMLENLCSVSTQQLEPPKEQVKEKMVTPRAAKMLNVGQTQGLLTSGQKSIKPHNIGGQIGEHSMIVDTGLASHDFLGEDADLLINMSFGGLEQQQHSSINESASTPSYTAKGPQEFPSAKHGSPKISGNSKKVTEGGPDPTIGLSALPQENSLVLTPPSPSKEQKQKKKAPPEQDGTAEEVKVACSPKSKSSDINKESIIASPATGSSTPQNLKTDEALIIQKAASEKVNKQEQMGETEEESAFSSSSLPVISNAEEEKEDEQRAKEENQEQKEETLDLDALHPVLKQVAKYMIQVVKVSDKIIKELGDEGAKQLALLIKSINLKTLNLSKNQISDVGARALFDALKHSDTLQTLNVSYNGISEAAIEFITSAVRVNQSLKALILSSNQITSRLAKNRLKQVSRSSLQIIF